MIADAAAEIDAITDDSWSEALGPLAEKVSLEEAEKLIDEKLVPLQRELGIDLSTVSH